MRDHLIKHPEWMRTNILLCMLTKAPSLLQLSPQDGLQQDWLPQRHHWRAALGGGGCCRPPGALHSAEGELGGVDIYVLQVVPPLHGVHLLLDLRPQRRQVLLVLCAAPQQRPVSF